MSLWDHLLALAVGIGLPLVGWWQHRRAPGAQPVVFTPREKVLTYWANSLQLAFVAGLTLWIWRSGSRTLEEIGLTAVPQQTGRGLALAALFLAGYLADLLHKLRPARLPRTRERWRARTPFMPATGAEVAHSLVMIAAAAVCEEIVYRGFLIAYVAGFTGGTGAGLALAVALPALVFGSLHLYQGVRSALLIVLLAGCFGAILVVTGSLWIPIALHLLVDLVGSLLGPWLMHGEESIPSSP